MTDAETYWEPLVTFVRERGCYVRIAWREDGSVAEGHWGQLFIIPTTGYLEASGGPEPIRNVEWVEISASTVSLWVEGSANPVKGNLGGRPLQIVDMTDEILPDLQGLPLDWEFSQSEVSVLNSEDEPARVIRFRNPYGPTFGSEAARSLN